MNNEKATQIDQLIENISDSISKSMEIGKSLNDFQKSILQKTDSSDSIHELRLALAENLIDISDQEWLQEQLYLSLREWLKLKGLSEPEGFDNLIETVSANLSLTDVSYVEKLNKYLAALGREGLNVLNSCYSRGVQHLRQKQAELAIIDFNDIIALHPNALAFYQRGRAYWILKNYGLALEDLNQAITLQRNYSLAYKARGHIYYVLGEYQLAIFNYDQAARHGDRSVLELKTKVEQEWEIRIKQEAAAHQKLLEQETTPKYDDISQITSAKIAKRKAEEVRLRYLKKEDS